MNYVIFILIIVIILYGWIIIRGHQTGEIYTKWGWYTGEWFIKKEKNPIAYKGKLYLYSAIFIFLILILIVFIFNEMS